MKHVNHKKIPLMRYWDAKDALKGERLRTFALAYLIDW